MKPLTHQQFTTLINSMRAELRINPLHRFVINSTIRVLAEMMEVNESVISDMVYKDAPITEFDELINIDSKLFLK